MDDHAVVQPRDGLAACTDEQPWDERVYEARQRGAEERYPKTEGGALMLQVRLSDRSRMVEEQSGEHGAPMLN
jgi:hypothetical protein